jgi:hypothetical protein
MNKKGMDLSLNFIILAVLGLISLIVIALFFTGGLNNLFKQTEDVGDVSAEKIALAAAECKLYCTTNNQESWDNPGLSEDIQKSVGGCAELVSGKFWDTEGKCKSDSAETE